MIARLLRFAAGMLYHLADPLVWLATKLEPPHPVRPVQRWFDGEPMYRLPSGASETVLRIARIHAYTVKQTVDALDTAHMQCIDDHNEHMTRRPSDERMRYLHVGAAHGVTKAGDAMAAIRDYIVARMGA